MVICSVPNCGVRAHSGGYCPTHYQRWRAGNPIDAPLKRRKGGTWHGRSALTRFETKYLAEPTSGCWLWEGTYNPVTGYGVFVLDNWNIHAHRASWLLLKGEIPDGLEVCHKCDNRGCVNPDHLFLGTHNENMQDAKKKKRMRTGDKRGPLNSMALKLDIPTLFLLKAEISAGTTLTFTELGEKYGVGRNVPWKIANGIHWIDEIVQHEDGTWGMPHRPEPVILRSHPKEPLRPGRERCTNGLREYL